MIDYVLPRERTGLAVKLLLEKGADPNIQGFEDFKRSPLHLAVCRNNQAAVKVLTMNTKCNVNLQVGHHRIIVNRSIH